MPFGEHHGAEPIKDSCDNAQLTPSGQLLRWLPPKSVASGVAKSSRIPIRMPKTMIPMTSGSFRRVGVVDAILGFIFGGGFAFWPDSLMRTSFVLNVKNVIGRCWVGFLRGRLVFLLTA